MRRIIPTSLLGFSLVMPVVVLTLNHYFHSEEPQLRPISNPDAMVWSYPGEFQARNFYDIRPFGSLDEVVYRTHDEKVVTLRTGDTGFACQEKVYNCEIVPLIQGERK